jgi:hypothetical protein
MPRRDATAIRIADARGHTEREVLESMAPSKFGQLSLAFWDPSVSVYG